MSQTESSTDVARVDPVVAEPSPPPIAAIPIPPAPSVAAASSRRSSPTLIGVAFIAVVLLFFGGVFIGQDFLVERHHNAGLYIEPKYLNFGEVWAVKDFKWRIPIQNISDRPVGIAEFTASCQCSLIEPQSLTIPPHSTAEVVATIDLTNGRDIDPYESARKFEVAIHPIVAVSTTSPPGFLLRGTAKDAFTPSPRAVDVGEILSRTAGEPKTIRLKAATPLSSLTALPQPDLTIDIKPVSANAEGEAPAEPHAAREGNPPQTAEPHPGSSSLSLPGSSSPPLDPPTDDRLPPTTDYLLTVTPSDQIPLGKIDRTILLQSTDAQGRQLPLFPIKITGEIVFDVAVEPRSVYAGVIEMGSTYQTTVAIHSRTGSKFAVIPVQQEPGVELEPTVPVDAYGEPSEHDPFTDASDERRMTATSPLAPESGVRDASFRLRVTPTWRGDQTAVARIGAINLRTGERCEIALPVIYYGAELQRDTYR